MPGAADGSGGGAATLGYDLHTRLTPLTTDFHEFIAQVGDENREVLQYGPFFQWSDKVRQEHNVPMGPANPQALNRYSYVLNNPLRYIDPTGHAEALSFRLTLDDTSLRRLVVLLDNRARLQNLKATIAGGFTAGIGIGMAILSAASGLGAAASGGLAVETAAITAAVYDTTGGDVDSSLRNAMRDLLEKTPSGRFDLDITIAYQKNDLGQESMYVVMSTGSNQFMVTCGVGCAAAHFTDALNELITQSDLWEQGHLGISDVRSGPTLSW